MKTSALLALLLLSPLAAAADGGPTRAQPHRTFLPEYVRTAPAPSALSLRLQAIRARYGDRRVMSPLAEAREQRRLAELRPLPAETLGALSRRVHLGDRTLTAASDRRLGSKARRELLSRPPAGYVRRGGR